MSNLRQITEIFNHVQQSSTMHRKSLAILQDIYKNSRFKDFLKVFIQCLKLLFTEDHSVANPYLERTLKFCVLFCTSLKVKNGDEEETCPFLAAVLQKVLKFHDVEVTRLGVCKFLNLLLKHLGEEESFLDEKICDNIRDAMLERIHDVKSSVRTQAVEILQRLQDPQDTNDIVIKTFAENILDSSAQVRKTLVRCIGLNMATISVILERCLDVDEGVRLSAYDKFAKIPVKALNLEHRQYILRNGIKDKNLKVNRFIKDTLLVQWFHNCNENYILLIQALKLDADEDDFKQTTDIVEKCLEIFFNTRPFTEIMKMLPIGQDKLISKANIIWEEIIFWRCLAQFIRKQNEKSGYIEQILPDLSAFCEYIRRIYKTRPSCKSEWECMQHDHIILELLKICSDYDLSDEVGRTCLKSLLTDILIDAQISYDAIVQIMQILKQLQQNVDERTEEICTIISEIRDPMNGYTSAEIQKRIHAKIMQMADIRFRLNMATDEQEMAVERTDFARAQELQVEIQQLKTTLNQLLVETEEAEAKATPLTRNDPGTLCKCLDILNATLMANDITSLTPSLRVAQDQFVQPLLISTKPEVFCRALKFFALCCCVDKALAEKSVKLFFAPLLAYKYMHTYDEESILIAIQSLTDIFMLYGPEIIKPEVEDYTATTKNGKKTGKTRQLFVDSQLDETSYDIPSTAMTFRNVIRILSCLLDDDSRKMRVHSCEALVKLICTGKIQSTSIFSRLLLKWFTPASAKDPRVRQLLAQMFTEYASNVPDSLQIIEQAFLPTLLTVMDAPKNCAIIDIDVDSMIRFLAEMCRPGRHRIDKGLDSHKNVAFLILEEICGEPNSKRCFVFAKALLYLEPPLEDENAIRDLKRQVGVMLELVKSKMVLKYIQKYKLKLEGVSVTGTTTNNTRDVAVLNDSNDDTEMDTFQITENDENIYNTPPPIQISHSDIEEASCSFSLPPSVGVYSSLPVKRKKLRGRYTSTTEEDFRQNENSRGYNSRQSKLSARLQFSETDSDTPPRKKQKQ